MRAVISQEDRSMKPNSEPTHAARPAGAPERLSPEAVAAKTPTGLPPIDVDARTSDSGDPVRRAASRIVTLDNANMAATDNSVDVDGKGMEARQGASKWQDNVIYSNASLDESVDTPDEGLGGFESRPGGSLPQIALRDGWRVRHVGVVEIERGDGKRVEHVIRFERAN
ncbi:2-oxoglutarate dehydrogenase [Burkholderia ubonensis]|nr:2-oxoglutarate dehydrogenase [Burkholderia ubonensis]KVU07365.1 2-oxoglutarate dehydrogenase [Burkholderia ubonensis]